MPDANEGSTHESRLERSWRVNAQAWTNAMREQRIVSRAAGTDAAVVDAVLRTNARRALSSWLDAMLASGFVIDATIEPLDAATRDPLSVLLRAYFQNPSSGA